MAASSSDALGILQILWHALQLPAMAGSLFLPILLLSLLASSLLFFSAYSVSPLVLDLVSKLSPLFKQPAGPQTPNFLGEIEQDLRGIARLSSAVAFFVFFSSLFLMVAAVYAFAKAYSAASLSPRQLLLRIARRWYETLVTRLYVVILSLGLALLSLIVIGTLALAYDAPSAAAAAGCCAGLGAVSILSYLYLSTRWSMSLVIAIVEETWGIGALSWSVELFIGNKKRGTLLTIILEAVRLAIYAALAVALAAPGQPPSPPPPPEAPINLWLVGAAASALWELYTMAVYTVFYYECRKSHGLDGRSIHYASLPSAATKFDARY